MRLQPVPHNATPPGFFSDVLPMVLISLGMGLMSLVQEAWEYLRRRRNLPVCDGPTWGEVRAFLLWSVAKVSGAVGAGVTAGFIVYGANFGPAWQWAAVSVCSAMGWEFFRVAQNRARAILRERIGDQEEGEGK